MTSGEIFCQSFLVGELDSAIMLMVVEISAATSLAIAGPKKFLLQHRILADDYIVTNIYTYLLKKIQNLKEEEKKHGKEKH